MKIRKIFQKFQLYIGYLLSGNEALWPWRFSAIPMDHSDTAVIGMSNMVKIQEIFFQQFWIIRILGASYGGMGSYVGWKYQFQSPHGQGEGREGDPPEAG